MFKADETSSKKPLSYPTCCECPTLLAFCSFSLGNKCQFWQIFVAALEESRNYFIQSKTSSSAFQFSDSNRASKYVLFLCNFRLEHRCLSHFSEKSSVPPTAFVTDFFVPMQVLLCLSSGILCVFSCSISEYRDFGRSGL